MGIESGPVAELFFKFLMAQIICSVLKVIGGFGIVIELSEVRISFPDLTISELELGFIARIWAFWSRDLTGDLLILNGEGYNGFLRSCLETVQEFSLVS